MIRLFLLLFISPAVRGFGICATFDKIIALKPHKNFETAMPFLWKYCNKDKTSAGYQWCYENKKCGQYSWAKQYPTCAGRRQSPINIPAVSVYSAGGSISSPGYPNTYYSQPHGCTKDTIEVEDGYSLAMKLKFQTQCCQGYPSWEDDLITISDGNRSVVFNQTEGFSFTSTGDVLINSYTSSASLKFCKYLSVVREEGYYLWYDAVLQPLTFANYDQIAYGDLENNGHTAKLSLSGGSMSGGPLDQSYEVKQLHFHWGTSDVRGSEHLHNGKSYPLEMQIIHSNGDDSAVAGFFFEIDKSDNDELQPLIDHLQYIRISKAKVSMKNEGFGLTSLLAGVAPLGSAPTTPYTSYTGSLTTPPCTEGVKWINFLTPLKISASQMEKFRTLLKDDGSPIRYNYRGVQLLNNRKVNKIDSTVPAPYNLDYIPSTNCVKKVVTGNYFDETYGVANVFKNNDTQPEGTYWLGPSNSQGSFIVDFGCQKSRSILELVNVHDGGRATKTFRVSSSNSHNGPWTELVSGTMEDTRQSGAKGIENFSFQSTSDQYYKFEALDYYGNGAGIQYLDAKDCIEGGHCASAEFYKNGFHLTISGSAEFLLGIEPRTTTSTYLIYSIRLSGDLEGDKFSVGLTSKCSVAPEPEQYLIRNKKSNLLENGLVFVDVGQTDGFSLGESDTEPNLLEFYVVVLDHLSDGNDTVAGCTTGRLSTGPNPLPPTEVLLVTGGDSEEDTPLQSIEIYDPVTGLSCDMGATANITLRNHAQIGLTICGGHNGTGPVESCSKMEDEEFQEIESAVLGGARDAPGMSWNSAAGFVICGNTTCDLLKDDDTVDANSIALWPVAIKSCTVTDLEEESMMIIGGEVEFETVATVSRYDSSGRIENLPDLIYARHSHGCAGYKDDQHKLVVIVAGGVWPGGDPVEQPIDKTELLLPSATKWIMTDPLPMVMQLLTNALVTVENVVYIIGGNGVNEGLNATSAVLEWNSVDLKWRDPGSVLNSPRINHAVGVIPLSFLQYCV